MDVLEQFVIDKWENSGLLQGIKDEDKSKMANALDATFNYVSSIDFESMPDTILRGKDKLSLSDFGEMKNGKMYVSMNRISDILYFLSVGLNGKEVLVDVRTLLFPMCRRIIVEKRKDFDPRRAHDLLISYSKRFNGQKYPMSSDLECEFLVNAVEEY